MKVVNTTHMTAHQNETNTSDIWQCVSLLMYTTTKYSLKLNEVLLTFTEVLVYISVLVIFYEKDLWGRMFKLLVYLVQAFKMVAK